MVSLKGESSAFKKPNFSERIYGVKEDDELKILILRRAHFLRLLRMVRRMVSEVEPLQKKIQNLSPIC